ncbi:hypothetical protein [Phenylobacterium sp.]|uniref:hypothetical protein n=1 Tax=Phenylobacterium sp. TaxID=1871053 RepID=UPI002F3F34C7
MKTYFIAALVLALATHAAAEPMPAGAVVLPGRMAKEMLNQCSRATPEMGEATWQPTADDIVAFETALPEALSHTRPIERISWDPGKWARQYVGLVRHGHRYIYGNFAPAYILDEHRKLAEQSPRLAERLAGPFEICDGGPRFFGAEYDVEGHRFTQIDFNGVA